MKAFVVDLAKCNGCYCCQIVCKDEHCGNDWSPIAAPQPETGHFWFKLKQQDRGRVPVVKVQYTPWFCAHCEDAPCMAASENDAVYKRADGLVIIDPEKAKGQRKIAESCPIDAIYWNEELDIPQKCTGCAHLLDEGWEVPRCVDVCPTEALRFGDVEEFGDELKNAVSAPELEGNGAKVFYLNWPKRFVQGCFVDRENNEVIIGADVEIKGSDGSVRKVTTDDFGEFILNDMEPMRYEVTICATGYEDANLVADATDADVVLGDIFAKFHN